LFADGRSHSLLADTLRRIGPAAGTVDTVIRRSIEGSSTAAAASSCRAVEGTEA
jgi:hypothetical protein